MIYIVRYQKEILSAGDCLHEALENANMKLKTQVDYNEIECLESPYTTAQKGFIYYTTTAENGFSLSH